MRNFLIAMAALAACAGSAEAAELHFSSTLAGNQYPTETGSAATGTATLTVDTDTQTIDAVVTTATGPLQRRVARCQFQTGTPGPVCTLIFAAYCCWSRCAKSPANRPATTAANTAENPTY